MPTSVTAAERVLGAPQCSKFLGLAMDKWLEPARYTAERLDARDLLRWVHVLPEESVAPNSDTTAILAFHHRQGGS